MINVQWPEKQKWTNEEIQAYYTQQMALLMEKQVEALNGIRRLVQNVYERERQERRTADLALYLMTGRDDVLLAFNGRGAVPLSELQQRIYRTVTWCNAEELRQAIPKTDYLVLEPTGRGYRVWRAEDYANRQGAATA